MILEVCGLKGLGPALLRHGRGRKVIAFDVFNTLVCRKVEGEWLKRATAFALRRLLEPRVHRWFLPSTASIFERRRELELQIVTERVARGEDNESDFNELARRWVGTWLPVANQEVIDACIEQELSLEEAALSPTPGIMEALTAARATGGRLIFVSDMYLTATQIWRLLRHCGLESFFDDGYSSTDVGRRKATGRMFPWLLRTEAIEPGELLFVGDDAEADQAQPGRYHIDTVHLVDRGENERRGRLKTLEKLATTNHAWNERLLTEVMQHSPHRVSRDDGDLDYELGQTLAPGFVAYVMETVELARRRDVHTIYFLAREGLTFLQIYARLLRKGILGARPPRARYLHVSRASTILPAMNALSWGDLQRFWRQYPNQTLLSLLNNLSLPADPFVGLAAAVGLTNPKRRLDDPKYDREFRCFLESREVHAAFVKHRDDARATLRDYLAYRGLWGQERVVIADIGWKGSMQDNLARAFHDAPGFPELFGSYFALSAEGEVHPRSHKHGCLADFRRGDPEELDLFRNSAIYEMVTQATHGSTVGYARRADNSAAVLPVLKEYEIERENAQRYFKSARRGVDDWTRDFCQVYALSPFTGEELRAGSLARALDYIRYPTKEQAEAFLRYSHVESFGVHHVSRFGFEVSLRELVSRSPRATWKELQRRFEHTMWREGVVRRTGFPMGPFLWDLWLTMQRTR